MSTVLITGHHTGIGLQAATTIASEFRLNRCWPVAILRELTQLRPLSVKGTGLRSLRSRSTSRRSILSARLRRRLARRSRVARSIRFKPFSATPERRSTARSPIVPTGYEETFAVNWLGHFLLLNLLLDCVSEKGRIVFTASGTHDPATMNGKMVGAAVEPDAKKV